MQKEKSCGAIVFRNIKGIVEFLIVQEKQGGHRFFPKGHVEEGETEEETALREIMEETGLSVYVLDDFREIISYIDYTKSVDKTVVFFLGEVVGGDLFMTNELQNMEWLGYQSALERLTHDTSKVILTNAYAFLIK